MYQRWRPGSRYLEIWNLVFMQNIRGEGPAKEGYPILGDLPAKNIDTGLKHLGAGANHVIDQNDVSSCHGAPLDLPAGAIGLAFAP